MEDFYKEVIFKTEPIFVELLADFIASSSNEAIEYEDTKVILRTQKEIEPILKSVKDLAKEANIPLDIEVSKKRNRDWIKSYQDSITPIEVGSFYIHPEWYMPKEDKINILINPALAFGSGHHATTYSSLEFINRVVKAGDSLLDVGCGSGILALAGRKLGAKVELCDTDALAIKSAKENFTLNGESFEDIWEGSANKSSKKYDIVVANIIADVLKAISSQLKARLDINSYLILSGILDKKEAIVTESFSELELIERRQKDEWITLLYRKNR